ncbi:MAG: AMP-binding protein [Myxococcota bacterium]|nr:AMP-binding protein [Myxococcota bacterium]
MVPEPHHNIAQWPSRWSQRRPTALALVDGDRRLSWADFESRVAATAGALEAMGIVRGDRVAFLLQNRTACLEVLLGAARLGAITLPMNARLSAPEIAYQLTDCRPRILVHETDFETTVEEALSRSDHQPDNRLRTGGPTDEFEAHLNAADGRSESAPVTPDDPVILMYTSGTTGKPKGALLPHRKVLYNSLNAGLDFGIRGTDRVLVVAPLFHSLGLQILSLPVLYAGGSLFLQASFDPALVWSTVEQEQITYFGGVPAMHQRLYDTLLTAAPGQWKTESLRFIFTAGSAVSNHLIDGFRQRGLLLMQGYGQTETSTLCCLGPSDIARKPGSVGTPVFHGEVRVIALDTRDLSPQHWQDVQPEETGEVVVRGPITMLGYWENPEATAATFVQGWLCTGDLAQVDPDGFLTLVGRSREMFISGGENVYPAEVEAVCREHPQIREIAVVGQADRRWGEVGRAHVLLEPGPPLSLPAFQAWARARLAPFKIPQDLVIEDSLPRTASGKVQKHLLRPAEND